MRVGQLVCLWCHLHVPTCILFQYTVPPFASRSLVATTLKLSCSGFKALYVLGSEQTTVHHSQQLHAACMPQSHTTAQSTHVTNSDVLHVALILPCACWNLPRSPALLTCIADMYCTHAPLNCTRGMSRFRTSRYLCYLITAEPISAVHSLRATTARLRT